MFYDAIRIIHFIIVWFAFNFLNYSCLRNQSTPVNSSFLYMFREISFGIISDANASCCLGKAIFLREEILLESWSRDAHDALPPYHVILWNIIDAVNTLRGRGGGDRYCCCFNGVNKKPNHYAPNSLSVCVPTPVKAWAAFFLVFLFFLEFPLSLLFLFGSSKAVSFLLLSD